MFKLVYVKCTNPDCEKEQESYHDTNKELEPCSECGAKVELKIATATHHRHGSWNLWSV